MIEPAQMRMARAALKWTVRQLATKAGVDKNTISRFEAGRDVLSGTLLKLERVLGEAGVIFLSEDSDSGPGARLTIKSIAQDRKRHAVRAKAKKSRTKPK